MKFLSQHTPGNESSSPKYHGQNKTDMNPGRNVLFRHVLYRSNDRLSHATTVNKKTGKTSHSNSIPRICNVLFMVIIFDCIFQFIYEKFLVFNSNPIILVRLLFLYILQNNYFYQLAAKEKCYCSFSCCICNLQSDCHYQLSREYQVLKSYKISSVAMPLSKTSITELRKNRSGEN